MVIAAIKLKDIYSLEGRLCKHTSDYHDLPSGGSGLVTKSCLTLEIQRTVTCQLLCLWDFQGKNTGVGCHFLLQGMKVKSESEVAQSCLTLSDPMDCSPPGSSIHGIFQARVLEWGAIAFSIRTLAG